MDFCNMQDSDHLLLERVVESSNGNMNFREDLRRYMFRSDKVLEKKLIIIVDQDPEVRLGIKKLIDDENPTAICLFARQIEEVPAILLLHPECDLLVANYYVSEDEINYDFIDILRDSYPKVDVMVTSHINDRDILDRVHQPRETNLVATLNQDWLKPKGLLKRIFGDLYGTYKNDR